MMMMVRPESHLGLHSRLDLTPKRLESRLSHHIMTRLEVTEVGDLHRDHYHSIGLWYTSTSVLGLNRYSSVISYFGSIGLRPTCIA